MFYFTCYLCFLVIRTRITTETGSMPFNASVSLGWDHTLPWRAWFNCQAKRPNPKWAGSNLPKSKAHPIHQKFSNILGDLTGTESSSSCEILYHMKQLYVLQGMCMIARQVSCELQLSLWFTVINNAYTTLTSEIELPHTNFLIFYTINVYYLFTRIYYFWIVVIGTHEPPCVQTEVFCRSIFFILMACKVIFLK